MFQSNPLFVIIDILCSIDFQNKSNFHVVTCYNATYMLANSKFGISLPKLSLADPLTLAPSYKVGFQRGLQSVLQILISLISFFFTQGESIHLFHYLVVK